MCVFIRCINYIIYIYNIEIIHALRNTTFRDNYLYSYT